MKPNHKFPPRGFDLALFKDLLKRGASEKEMYTTMGYSRAQFYRIKKRLLQTIPELQSDQS